MADLNTPNLEGDNRPISLRRKRRGSVDTRSHSRSNSRTAASQPHGITTPPATPKRAKKRVRFSDPGPSDQLEYEASGLTPFIRRTVLSTPTSKRRHSTPASLWNRSPHSGSPSGTIQFESLQVQILEDRAIRRLRRNGLSEEQIKIEVDKKHVAKGRKREVERLRHKLEEKDSELRRANDELTLARQIGSESGVSLETISSLSARVRDQEEQILTLESALRAKESEAANEADWTMAAQDPFNFDDDDDMVSNYDEDFRECTMNDEMMTTPTRLQISFPSPPSTIPNTPCKSVSTSSASTQASLPTLDAEKDALKSQLESLQSELSSTIALHEDNQSRLSGKLSEFLPVDESHDQSSLDSALDAVLTQLALSQSHELEQRTAFSALGNEITKLGFSPGSSPDAMIAAIAAQFRQARLELEYITPGETVEGFENDKLLEMLVSRIRVLNQRAKEGDDKIDQYHEQEVSLRQQLGTRVDAMRDVQKDLVLATSIIGELKQEISEKDLSNKKLQTALQTYRDEVKGLENLIERMDTEKKQVEEKLKGEIKEAQSNLQTEILQHDTTRADNEGKDILVAELEMRLNATLQAYADVQTQMDALLAEKDTTIQHLQSSGHAREKAHGDALALRDARFSELRREMDLLDEKLKASYSDRLTLGSENKHLRDREEVAKVLIRDMYVRLGPFVENGDGNSHDSAQGGVGTSCDSAGEASTSTVSRPIVRPGKLFDASLARRSSTKTKKRRYDSGLGFLEEDGDEDVSMEADMA